MKLLIKTIMVAATIVVPALAFAETNGPLTRAQVRSQLIELEQAGYNPGADCSGNCPEGLQRAEGVVARRRQSNANAAYGPALNGTTQAGK
ncbi:MULTISPECIES: DUF4148 domain-containing protein [unclassified Paraburkholderia]|uniref:DUF4148 domain-containing protein n=1 Tax=unclassified Paraburkholderia TaxID=2615204 RepID=UPI000E25B70B|nr:MULTISPECIES: DUF4148 domain-containing protein [unclassified Paraburkholderia]REE21456.1 uncharacterized protein DUF4148 [Paraburkholderia sp. BL27I4N3]RKR38592.1 uncharacterized protein DUF4148 [Paraburkholderia sp. BL17N1]